MARVPRGALAGITGLIGAIAGLIAATVALTEDPAIADHFRGGSAISIDRPQDDQIIPMCATIEGKGSAPRGSHIWVAQRGYGDRGIYNLTEVAQKSKNTWSLQIDIGPKKATGKRFTIFAVVLTDDVGDVLKNIATDDGDDRTPPSDDHSFSYLKNLPDGQSAQVNVHRDGHDATSC